jgi:hypothetical protein
MRIVEMPRTEAIALYTTFCERMERRYECKSERIAEAVRGGSIRETAEVRKWLFNHVILGYLLSLEAVKK